MTRPNDRRVPPVSGAARQTAAALVLGAALLAAPAPTRANLNHEATIELHLTAPIAKNACAVMMAQPPICDSHMRTWGSLYPNLYYAYVILANADQVVGARGISLGIQYDPALGQGVDVFGWTLCADLQVPANGWPDSGGGNQILWQNCQRTIPPGDIGVKAVAGYFYCAAYSPGQLRITAHPNLGEVRILDCNDASVRIADPVTTFCGWSQVGQVDFGGGIGFSPCSMLCGPAWRIMPGSDHCLPYELLSFGDPDANPNDFNATWRVAGDCTIVSQNAAHLVVRAADAGSFQVAWSIYGFECGSCSEKRIFIDTPVNVQPSTWSSIKGLFAPSR